ncbi:hypothetical protein FHL15_001528 [Xylaria flabelliformis]|uniref:glucan endo-1,3-beta-D-glucosidase n=1 Tax=Xylaria flabelliformis TaxID=2512241 RepID=A0A553IC44_9PEZI|nr:hypothetical protein FHL15_001528 [Xylaria flabelliformis]
MQIRFLAIALAVLAAPSTASAYRGFNYGSLKDDGSCQEYDGFKQLFERAKNLPGASDFTAARLYTSVQCGTSVVPIEAFRAAIDTDTKILVGLWASAGRDEFKNELNALINAVTTLGSAFTDRVIGISVGSEDLYRSSPAGIANKAGPGATAVPQTNGKSTVLLVLWTAWILPESKVVIDAVDFLSQNSFPYFEDARPNAIEQASDNFWSGLSATVEVAQGKDIWITETGWPAIGPTLRDAVPSVENARTYWNTVGCALFEKRNTFWYTLVDAAMTEGDHSFGITPADDTTPKFDLACS